MRARNQHQGAIELAIVGENDRATQRAHARHTILAMPGLEVGVPIKTFALEARLIVDSRLVDINPLPQQLLHHSQQARITGQPAEACRNFVNTENGANLLPTRLQHCTFRELEIGIILIVTQLLDERLHLLSFKKALEREKALLLVLTNLRFAERACSALIALREHDRINPLEHTQFAFQTRRKQILHIMLHCLFLLDLNETPVIQLVMSQFRRGSLRKQSEPAAGYDNLLSRADKCQPGDSCPTNAAQAALATLVAQALQASRSACRAPTPRSSSGARHAPRAAWGLHSRAYRSHSCRSCPHWQLQPSQW